MVESVALGQSPVRVVPLGLGTWAWGDRAVWGYGGAYGEKEVREAFQASLDGGVNFLDTAEMYGRGLSERMVGELTRGRSLVIATKFMPVRWSASTLPGALDASLARLERSQVDLYQIHWPVPWLPIRSLMNRLADAVKAGKVKAVGVSNFSERQMRTAHSALAAHGVPLASNQVEYSLLHRKPESSGVLAACRELGVTLIAYSPLAKGALSGKYSGTVRPSGARRWMPSFGVGRMEQAESTLQVVRAVAERHGKTPSQVALRWLIQQGTVPIPGAKDGKQAADNAGALGFSLEKGEMDELDRVSRSWLPPA